MVYRTGVRADIMLFDRGTIRTVSAVVQGFFKTRCLALSSRPNLSPTPGAPLSLGARGMITITNLKRNRPMQFRDAGPSGNSRVGLLGGDCVQSGPVLLRAGNMPFVTMLRRCFCLRHLEWQSDAAARCMAAQFVRVAHCSFLINFRKAWSGTFRLGTQLGFAVRLQSQPACARIDLHEDGFHHGAGGSRFGWNGDQRVC